MTTSRRVVISDLDGTLLRHEDFDPTDALPALAALAHAGIPVVLASSKTRVEMEAWRSRLDLFGPFIVENGGALLWPVGGEPPPPPEAVVEGPYARIVYGTAYGALRAALGALASSIGVALRGFGDVSGPTLVAWTGLDGSELERARQREYDEPFLPERELRPHEEVELHAAAAALGLRVTRGGRLYHLLGPSSKASAARDVRRAYGGGGVDVLVTAVGDGPNDLELLVEADDPVVVARPDGSHHPSLVEGIPRARFTRAVGPAGFAEAMEEILDPARASDTKGRSRDR